MRGSKLAFAVAALCVTGLGAQAQEESRVNASLSTAILMLQKVEDGRSLASWEIEPAQQYRASLDLNIGERSTFGVTVGYAPLSLLYERIAPMNGAPDECLSFCTVNGDLVSAGAAIRVMSGGTFHQLLEVNASLNRYSNFREQDSGLKLAPLDGDSDIAVSGGYGIGWTASKRLEVSLIGDVGFMVHTRSGPQANSNHMIWLTMARLVVRTGIW